MSLTTAFPFHAYVGDLRTRAVHEQKSDVSLSLMTSEDIARLAFVEVRVRCGQEDHLSPWNPTVRRDGTYPTFYDTRMGNFNVRTFPPQACSSCCNTLNGKFGNERCQGHYGYISMPRRYPNDPSRGQEHLSVINPHLAQEVEQLLQAECFFCHRLRVPEFDVVRYQQALRLVDAGLIGDALRFLDMVANAHGQEMRLRRRRDVNETVINDVPLMLEHVEKLLRRRGVCDGAAAAGSENGGGDARVGAGEVEERPGTDEHVHKSTLDVRNEICKLALRKFREYSNVCTHCQNISPRITTKNGHLFFFFNKKNADFNVANGGLTLAQLREWEEINRRQGRSHSYFRTSWVREHIKQLCQHEPAILAALFPHLGEATVNMPYACPLPPTYFYKVFFLDKLLVPPLQLRLSSGVQISDSGTIVPDARTRALSDVLGFVEQIEAYYVLYNNSTPERNLVSAAQDIAQEHNLRNLQAKVTEVFTDVLESFAKKEGLFRMHMMGKRVNQACRSVISPDYMLEPNEVLLPRPFARALTFPELVSSYSPARTLFLKRCVMNGPDVYPGATHLEIGLPSGETRFVDLHVPEPVRRQHAMKYFAMAQTGSLTVHRHILDGDRLIFNRQPTLHKVSMMAYRAKVLSGLKTLRFHYVNGSSYNADFDGDEMNIHVVQSLEARAELECLMDANLNYLVPTSGKPIRGFIQDHIVAGVLLTLRDKFLPHHTFVQFVYNGIAPYMQKHGNPLSAHATLTELIPMPTILKPRPLWTGKQLISVIVHYVTGVVESRAGRPKSHGVSMHGTSLVQPSTFTTTDPHTGKLVTASRTCMEDGHVHFFESELITGVLCKNQLGAANLSVVHVIHEIYGPHMVGELFGALGRVLTISLQREGFSIGMDDMLLVQEERRRALLRELDNAPLTLPDDEGAVMPVIMGMATNLQKEFVPGRMLRRFPQNQLLLMTMSGAKGSNTNTIQMSLGLGQQLFDGRRVRRMNSGKTLPSFFADEKRARSLGYAIGRFASGIRPAEYTIHAMAGRDGLIDTAVKTSRSGHLQRCLIKGLESLVVQWDRSVRDANGSVVQFLYGGDGLDPMRTSSLQAWEVVKDNCVDLGRKMNVNTGVATADEADEEAGRNSQGKRERADDVAAAMRAAQRALLEAEAQRDPLPGPYKASLDTYLETKAQYPLFKKVAQVARWTKNGVLEEKLKEKRTESIQYYRDVMTELTTRRRVRAYCDPGEPVGLLAAQAAGEPSTQMTLNTFHSAGSTVTHVTEGIPRLRELLIYASVQQVAVVVPVEKATEADEVAIARVLQAGVATRLTDCMARVPAAKTTAGMGGGGDVTSAASTTTAPGYHYHVTRSAEGTQITVALLFSKAVLQHKQQAMCMAPTEHLQSFMQTLKNFARQVVTALRGRSKEEQEGGAAGLMRGATQDPMHQMEEDGAAAAGASDDDDDDGDRSTQLNTPALGAAAAPSATASEVGRDDTLMRMGDDDSDGESGSEDEEGEDGEAESDGSDGSGEEGAAQRRKPHRKSRARRHAAKAEEDEDDDDEEMIALAFAKRQGNNASTAAAAEAGNGANGTVNKAAYDAFPAIRALYGNKKYQVEIAPLLREAAARDGVVDLPDDLFIVNVAIHTSDHVVAVIPDVLESALAQQTFPSWLSQFDTVTYTRKAEDPSSGEMVFQGRAATIRNVTAFLALFTVRARAIKVRKARSTDIRDMCTSFGVESGYRALFDELEKLFKRYAVDYHHLTLIADAATHRGVWENFNFTGVIAHSASPLFQMTFASSKRFLHTALTRGVGDELSSISSAIMVGARPRVGTACVKVGQDPQMLRDVIEKNLA
ncbi:putative DNA-directed rna polymerase I largest subunit [Leptomonas pyrrhocoris]|uniref:DNA-directed RNA polymerase I subunit RPA1 n=1 Tax=Leptomonas pyrrhocoris TaxID=157538 RepID=A0A0N0DTW7_LEPPY|nr:putative DNA-directed rna polymerase I largest subunit [Leptomonas pyrrhocoris]KPA78034.1 putative DNA-directed rna polymerase I largest subunit [Leptomonas pyrrhocoris]|eukprot:XP_015656473.1 putative DNA-directed rna polymerase I largest subunit [Leptomonas pyrrhocoris]